MTRYAHCINGHRWTEANTRHYGPGKRYRACRTCAAERGRKRYRENPEVRARSIATAQAWYAANKKRVTCETVF